MRCTNYEAGEDISVVGTLGQKRRELEKWQQIIKQKLQEKKKDVKKKKNGNEWNINNKEMREAETQLIFEV